MKTEELIQQFPTKRIKAIDGLTVTADVWEEAHDFHRQNERSHAALMHGAGVVTGLEVVASDPADTSVYVKPGIAVDAEGRIIVVAEPTAYDIGRTMDGQLYLLLAYDEGRPVAEGNGSGDGSPLYVHSQFSIAASPSVPDAAHVELARIRRVRRDAVITDAKIVGRPGANEIDLRYRRHNGATEPLVETIGVVYFGGQNARHSAGINNVARSMSLSQHQKVVVDEGIDIRAGVERYALVYLVGSGDFQMGADDMTGIYNYLQAGGTILYETCRHDTTGKNKADAAFMDMLGSFGVKLADLAAGHELLNSMLLFAAQPSGFETAGAAVQVADGIIFSSADYGCLWQGEKRGGVPAREEIRSATEWGTNILAYAAQRRAKASSRKA